MTGLLPEFPGRNAQAVSRRQKLNPFKTSPRPRDRGKGEDVIESLAVGSRRNHSGSEQAFDFGGKEQPVALPAPEKWRDPEAITSEMELSLSLIPQARWQIVRAVAPTSLRGDPPKGAE